MKREKINKDKILCALGLFPALQKVLVHPTGRADEDVTLSSMFTLHPERAVLRMRTPRGQTKLKSLVCKKSCPVVVFKSCRSYGAGTRSWMCLGELCACGDKT